MTHGRLVFLIRNSDLNVFTNAVKRRAVRQHPVPEILDHGIADARFPFHLAGTATRSEGIRQFSAVQAVDLLRLQPVQHPGTGELPAVDLLEDCRMVDHYSAGATAEQGAAAK